MQDLDTRYCCSHCAVFNVACIFSSFFFFEIRLQFLPRCFSNRCYLNLIGKRYRESSIGINVWFKTHREESFMNVYTVNNNIVDIFDRFINYVYDYFISRNCFVFIVFQLCYQKIFLKIYIYIFFILINNSNFKNQSKISKIFFSMIFVKKNVSYENGN